MDKDVFGRALIDYQAGKTSIPLLLHNSYGQPEDMPTEVFFRTPDDFSELEHIALVLCDGHTLDIGAGAGSHALYLQNKGMNVTALEISPNACQTMHMRGIENIINADIYAHTGVQYDTLLMLMNGIGIAGQLAQLPKLLEKCKSLLKPGGQLLFDSSDISYLYEDPAVVKPVDYHGEVRFQYEYLGNLGQPFDWLYVDQQALIELAQPLGWVVQILYEDEYDQYLARMEVKG